MITRRTRRRVVGLVAAVISTLLLYGVLGLYGRRMHPVAPLSGWLLAVTVVALASFGVRKKIPGLPLGRASQWMRVHAVVGAVSVALFAAHAFYTAEVGVRWPRGIFEQLLAVVYVATAASGGIGLVLSRSVPPRLTVAGEELIFERLPSYRRELRERAEQLVLGVASVADSTALPDFYLRRLAPHFDGAHDYWQHLVQSDGPRHRLVADVRAVHRYLGEAERGVADQLETLALKKVEVDYVQAMQGTLKAWVILHAALTGILMLFVVVHVWSVYAYGGAG